VLGEVMVFVEGAVGAAVEDCCGKSVPKKLEC